MGKQRLKAGDAGVSDSALGEIEYTETKIYGERLIEFVVPRTIDECIGLVRQIVGDLLKLRDYREVFALSARSCSFEHKGSIYPYGFDPEGGRKVAYAYSIMRHDEQLMLSIFGNTGETDSPNLRVEMKFVADAKSRKCKGTTTGYRIISNHPVPAPLSVAEVFYARACEFLALNLLKASAPAPEQQKSGKQ
ncbi:MAG: hypothetical protein V1659_05260 [Candidatus Woesearchaeota archaeon]